MHFLLYHSAGPGRKLEIEKVWKCENEGQRARGATQETSRGSKELTHRGGFDALALVDVAGTFQTSVFHTFTLPCL